jgi:TonB family protein
VEQLQPVKPTPIPEAKTQKSQPSVEILTEKASQTAAPVARQLPAAEELATPPAEELATPAATPEKRPHLQRRATSAPQPRVAESPVARQMSMSGVKAIAVSAPRLQYPYEAQRAHITGSGVCLMIVDAATGKVTSAVMAQSTGNAVLDKVTTDTFLRWRFKPGTVSQIRVPITYE